MKYMADHFETTPDGWRATLRPPALATKEAEDLTRATFNREPVEVVARDGDGWALARGHVKEIGRGELYLQGIEWREARWWEEIFIAAYVRAIERLAAHSR